jgi:hypothetical protein
MARPKKRGAKAYGWDRFFGFFGMLIDVLGVAFGSVLVGMGLTDSKLVKMDQPKVYAGIGLFIVIVASVRFVINLGIFNSRRWAFILAALLAGWGMYAGSFASSGLILLYTVLRLGQVFGPPLK